MGYSPLQQERIAQGHCIGCGGTPRAESMSCLSCTQKRAEAQQLRRKKRLLAGSCPLCGATLSPGQQACSRCCERAARNTRNARRRRAEAGICSECNGVPLPAFDGNATHRLCEVCYLKKTARERLGSRRHWGALGDKLRDQDYRCAYTGVLLVLGVNDSLDHIKPAHHYPELRRDPSNVEWVTREINSMKRDRTPDEFLSLLHSILAYRVSRQTLTGAVVPVV